MVSLWIEITGCKSTIFPLHSARVAAVFCGGRENPGIIDVLEDLEDLENLEILEDLENLEILENLEDPDNPASLAPKYCRRRECTPAPQREFSAPQREQPPPSK